jgi:hypothetical protein
MIKCVICGETLSEEEFKGHPYKTHKIKLENYYEKYFPKNDLYSGEKIPFKSISQYLSSDFLNKNNFKMWIKANSRDTVRDYCIDWLKHRKDLKGLRFAPSQTELKTLTFPSIAFLEELFSGDGGYYGLCQSLGYSVRHNKISKNTKLPISFSFSEQAYIIKDTREGRPLIFAEPSIEGTLNWGDYGLSDESLSDKVRIERKSLTDLIGTLSSGYERFTREIDRAGKDGGYIVVLVEERFQNLLSFNFLPHISKRVRAKPDFICHRIRELCQYFDNFQLLCVDGRKEAAKATARILQLGKVARTTDLQLCYDLGILSCS